ncbi:MAG: hypothetical protein PVF85_13810 [Anaerolineales bacterium]|jgi:hypothetical protein
MIGSNELFILGLLIAAILFVVVFFAFRTNKQEQGDVSFAEAIPEDDPLVNRDEFQATPIAEVIEELVRQKTADMPGLAALDVDFGTAPDGGLEIWINDERYTRVDDLPDEALQKVIREAVEEYNQGS